MGWEDYLVLPVNRAGEGEGENPLPLFQEWATALEPSLPDNTRAGSISMSILRFNEDIVGLNVFMRRVYIARQRLATGRRECGKLQALLEELGELAQAADSLSEVDRDALDQRIYKLRHTSYHQEIDVNIASDLQQAREVMRRDSVSAAKEWLNLAASGIQSAILEEEKSESPTSEDAEALLRNLAVVVGHVTSELAQHSINDVYSASVLDEQEAEAAELQLLYDDLDRRRHEFAASMGID